MNRIALFAVLASATLGDAEFAGQIEVRTKWTEGYGAMTVADGGDVKSPPPANSISG